MLLQHLCFIVSYGPSTGLQSLGVLPTSEQLQSAAINQFTTEYQGLGLQTVSTTSGTSSPTQGTQSAPNESSPTTRNTLETVTTWLYGDAPSASNSNIQLTEPTNTLVPIGAGLPPLPKKLVQQIKAGEFINFSDLPPAKARPPTVIDRNQMSI